MEEVYTVQQVAKKLQTNIAYIHQLRKAGLLQFLKLGQYKCLSSTLEKFLKKYEEYDLTSPKKIKKLDEAMNQTENIAITSFF
ncbi:MAG: helix-turn-helix domain-containing protein [Elusimicrobiota bacterium]|jgi:hypothetical protein|nr:helix-turn-helix domain-containing protein [Elusimicrobiota bacterium]